MPLNKQKTSTFEKPTDTVFEPAPLFKLKMYSINGELRADIPRAVALEMGKTWGDIISAIADQRWYTKEEILNAVQEQERRNPRKAFNRTLEIIESAVDSLIQHDVMITR
jgi:hypothetical protein